MIVAVCQDDQAQFSSAWTNVKLCKTDIFSNTSEVIRKLEKYYRAPLKTLGTHI
jgi:hypothetical protein